MGMKEPSDDSSFSHHVTTCGRLQVKTTQLSLPTSKTMSDNNKLLFYPQNLCVVCNTELGLGQTFFHYGYTVFQHKAILFIVLNASCSLWLILWLNEVDKCLLRTYYVPNSILRAFNTMVTKKQNKKTPKISAPTAHGCYILTERTDNK